ncbi:tRNA uridine-5-carboxymethylaminomethyl(34) synthesis GTPase MnmE [Methylocystis echinoides]|uniref:tRNA modification GTPase MnmE n=1 Tax=Methylocystis echinoides TaxID=29468 RepID=A0A9W6GQV9_9HYPH|nr:tRNA uridine-5-carboxymethylaminomethyl(34) synthesis GTPase MnmE [Methylocystis echinoides]GLI91263.1 tRNA modification GTPase MnmE [Methylocystis echinoides]
MATIFASGTGAGRAAIAVIRISGPAVRDLLTGLAGALPSPRLARLATLRDPATGEALDQGILLFFPGPRSATGEDYAELHIHGGSAVVNRILTTLSAFPGLRPAEAGEFARRGFANGKLDLSQAEALADLIDAQTEAQRRQALRVAGGALRRQVESWRAALIDALAMVEAELDFSDEADVSAFDRAALRAALDPIRAEMRAALLEAPASERLREGFLVMIMGPPNAGKSTLLNALARRDLAIVSATPGTTRDMIEAHLDIAGLPVTVVDTAGLREAADEIERIGVDRVLARVETADLALWLSTGGGTPPEGIPPGVEPLKVSTKSDLRPPPAGWLGVCATSGMGLGALLDAIALRAKARLGDGGSSLLIRDRHRAAIASAFSALDHAVEDEKDLEFAAEDLRSAARALGRIVGAVDVEHVLDAVFSRFCIGK